MRTFDAIRAEIDSAAAINDADRMLELADELTQHRSDEAQMLVMQAKAYALNVLRNISEAISLYEQIMDVQRSADDGVGLARTLMLVGNVYANEHQYARALESYQQALHLYTEHDKDDGVARCYEHIGSAYSGLADYAVALEYCHRALKLHERMQNKARMASTYNHIGNIHRRTSNYPTALAAYQHALRLYEEITNLQGIALVYGNIGTAFSGAGDLAEAMRHYERALAIHHDTGDDDSAIGVILNIGNVHFAKGSLRDAQGAYEQAHALATKRSYRAGVEKAAVSIMGVLLAAQRYDDAEAYQHLHDGSSFVDPLTEAYFLANCGELHLQRNDLETAHALFDRALAIAIVQGERSVQADVQMQLRDLAQVRNDFAGYIKHDKEYQRIKEDIRGTDVAQKFAIMAAEQKMEAERREHEQHRALLYGALPESVVRRLLGGEKVTSDQFTDAAVLFIDVVGFTSHAATMHPADVVQLLDDMFGAFDTISAAHEVIKIKTIGDSYMCFRGDVDALANALSIARVAFDVMHVAFTWPDGSPIQYRIGAHIGAVTAGVIGTQRLQYDVWGDTVNVASRLEGTSEPGRIHVSEAFADVLRSSSDPGPFNLIQRGAVEIKGKGAMQTYWLEGA